MSAIAEKIDERLRSLSPEEADRLERLLAEVLEICDRKSTKDSGASAFHTEPRPLGLKPGFSYDNWAELVETAEGPLWK